MRTSTFVRARWRVGLVGLLAALAGVPAVASPAVAHQRGPGSLYTQSNATPSNEIIVFDRAGDGTISEVARVPTGGAGSPAQPPFGQPHLDSQNAVELTANGRLLFAVNAGSGTVSSFRIGPHGRPRLVDVESSEGTLPISVDTHKGLLYVLNELSGNIFGLRYDNQGEMTPIAGSSEPLSTPGPGGVSSQVGFDPKGKVLTVTERITNTIDTFVVGADGTPGPAVANPSNALTPFSFVYDRDRLLVANAGQVGPMEPGFFIGSASSYALSPAGTLSAIENVATDGLATCWIVLSDHGRYAFATNTGSGNVSRLKVANSGDLTLLGTTPTSGAPSDVALSRDSHYLYVLNVFNPAGASIDAYHVGGDGSLQHLGVTPGLPEGASGLVSD